MFTIKLYKDNSYKRIYEAESFTILNESYLTEPKKSWSEITAHFKDGEGLRFDVGPSPYIPSGGCWDKAIIENAFGKTTEIISDYPH